MSQQAKRDEIARQIFGGKTTYSSLSAWARMSIDATIAAEEEKLATTQTGLSEDSLRHRIAQLEDQLAVAKKENNDLWEENETMKLELMERDEDILSRGTEHGQDEAS